MPRSINVGEVAPATPQDPSTPPTGRQALEVSGDGLRISLSRVRGWTAEGLLTHALFLQCPPLETFTIVNGFAHSDYDTLRQGQFSRPSGRQLRTVQFQTLIVDFRPPWAFWAPPVSDSFTPLVGGVAHPLPQGVGGQEEKGAQLPNPLQVADELEEILNSGTPFQFRAANPAYWGASRKDLTMMATLRSMSVEERAGEVDARYFDLSFTEYRRAEVSRKAQGFQGGGKIRNLPYKHTLQKGDTLTRLAKKYYGSTNRWRNIAKANGVRNLAASGDVYAWGRAQHRKYLTIPAVDKDGRTVPGS